MIWAELGDVWRRAMTLAWTSFCEGNLPIAAVLTDKDGCIVSEGRNHFYHSERFAYAKLDHAEAECLQTLPAGAHPAIRDYTLYTTMEPCPMCMGTIVMADIRHVQIAAHDPWAGAMDICRTSPYIADKHIDVRFMPDVPYGDLQAALMGYVELAAGRGDGRVWRAFSARYPAGTRMAQRLFAERALDGFRTQGVSAETAVGYVLAQLSPDELGK